MKNLNKYAVLISLLLICVLSTACSSGEQKPSAPVINSAVYGDDGSVDVVWDFVDEAAEYAIYRSETEDGTYTLMGTVSSEAFLYNDSTVEDYKMYWYKVEAIDENGNTACSEIVSSFTQGRLKENPKITFEVMFEYDSEMQIVSGAEIGRAIQNFTMKVKMDENYISNFEYYCDTEKLKPVEKENGVVAFSPVERGNYIITVKAGNEEGNIRIVLDQMLSEGNVILDPDNDDDDEYHIWNGVVTEVGDKKSSYTVKLNNGEAVSDFDVSSSDERICSVEKDGSNIIIINKAPGSCNIEVCHEGETTSFKWLVRRGKATGNVAKAKSVSQESYEKIIRQFTTPEYSKEEILQMVQQNLTLDQWAEKIGTATDAIQLLYALDYNKTEQDLMIDVCQSSDITRTNWIFDYTAQQNFELRYGSCAGTSNLINRLLMDDFDEAGYVSYSNSIEGGHIFNYFKTNGLYVTVDLVGIPGVEIFPEGKYPTDTTAYFVYICSDPEEFKDYYMKTYSIATVPDPQEGIMACLTFIECKGDTLPGGFDYDNHSIFVFAENDKDHYNILFIRDGFEIEFRPLEEAVIPSFRKSKVSK